MTEIVQVQGGWMTDDGNIWSTQAEASAHILCRVGYERCAVSGDCECERIARERDCGEL